MSVQAGIWNFDGEQVNQEFLASVSRSIAEYGPDGENTHFDGPVGMLYRPFHTTLESHAENQPYVFDHGKVITWDGRLDNRDELMPQLKRDMTNDRTDVAVVAAAFDRWGKECFARLIGDWAVSIWDPCEQELLLARDYIGTRHLFFYVKPQKMIWCNHLAPLALCGDRFTVCDEYIAGYLAFYPDAHLTPFREIASVPPGTFVQIRGRKTATHTYWSFNKQLATRYKTDAEYEEHYRYLFRQAVRRRLRTDSQVLAELSGGFDSSSIVCMADDIHVKENLSSARVDTFSFHDSMEPEEDDLPHFTKVEEKRRKAGFHADLRGCGDSFAFEYPVFVARPGFGQRVEVKAAMSDILQRHGYRVLLSGESGDEMNGQTLDPRVQMADLFIQFQWVELAKQLTDWSLLIRKRPWIQLFFQTLLQLMPVSMRRRWTPQGRVEPWVNGTFAKEHRMSARQIEAVEGLWFTRPSVRDAIQNVMTLSRRVASAAPSIIEKRYPYLDQNLVEFLSSIPRDQLLRPGQRRYLMRRALADLLPPEVLNRKIKARFGRCFCVALEKHWQKLERVLHRPLSSHLGYVERDQIRKAFFAMKNGELSTQGHKLLDALSLEFWLRDAEARGVILIERPVPLEGRRNLVESKA